MHTTATASCSASIFFHCSGDHRDLHSFPTRRSSDLPPEILLTGVIVNNQGERFVAEDSYHSRTSAFVLEQPDQVAYLIVDEAHTEMPAMPLIRFIDGWETVEEMEEALGIPEGKLVATL